jgi:hypothetical protein
MLAVQLVVALREGRAAQRLQLKLDRQHGKPGIGIDRRRPFLDTRQRLRRLAIGVVQRGLDLRAFLGLVALHELKQDRLLVRKIRVERTLRKSRRIGDVANRGQGETFFHDLVACRLDQQISRTRLTFLAI